MARALGRPARIVAPGDECHRTRRPKQRIEYSKKIAGLHPPQSLFHRSLTFRSEIQSHPPNDRAIREIGTGRGLVPELPKAVVLKVELLIQQAPHAQARNSAPIWKAPAHCGIDHEEIVRALRKP